jgi:hypothetical protein
VKISASVTVRLCVYCLRQNDGVLLHVVMDLPLVVTVKTGLWA